MLVGYGRASLVDADPAIQEDALRAAGCERVVLEPTGSGKHDRPQLAPTLDGMGHGDVLVVWRLDRLVWSTRQLVRTVKDLAKRGVALRSVVEGIDTGVQSTAHVFKSIANLETNLIHEQTAIGIIAAKKARGRAGGPPRKMTAEKVETVRELRARGGSISSIAASVGVSRSTVHRVLHNPAYGE